MVGMFKKLFLEERVVEGSFKRVHQMVKCDAPFLVWHTSAYLRNNYTDVIKNIYRDHQRPQFVVEPCRARVKRAEENKFFIFFRESQVALRPDARHLARIGMPAHGHRSRTPCAELAEHLVGHCFNFASGAVVNQPERPDPLAVAIRNFTEVFLTYIVFGYNNPIDDVGNLLFFQIFSNHGFSSLYC